MKLDTSAALKAALIGVVAGIIFVLIGRIPLLGTAISCIFSRIAWVIALVVGALYVQFAAGKVELLDGGVGGGLAGAIAGGVPGFAAGLLDLLFSDGGFGGMILATLSGAGIGAVLGAIGGLIYAAVKK